MKTISGFIHMPLTSTLFSPEGLQPSALIWVTIRVPARKGSQLDNYLVSLTRRWGIIRLSLFKPKTFPHSLICSFKHLKKKRNRSLSLRLLTLPVECLFWQAWLNYVISTGIKNFTLWQKKKKNPLKCSEINSSFLIYTNVTFIRLCLTSRREVWKRKTALEVQCHSSCCWNEISFWLLGK